MSSTEETRCEIVVETYFLGGLRKRSLIELFHRFLGVAIQKDGVKNLECAHSFVG